jgi:hypothetical protein
MKAEADEFGMNVLRIVQIVLERVDMVASCFRHPRSKTAARDDQCADRGESEEQRFEEEVES